MNAILVALACLGTLVLGLLVYFVLKKRDESDPCNTQHGNSRTTQLASCAIEVLDLPTPPPYDNRDVPPPYCEGDIDLSEGLNLGHETTLDFAPPPYEAVQEDPPPYSEAGGGSPISDCDVIQ